MNRVKRMAFGLMTAIFLSAAIPVSTPFYNNVMTADAAAAASKPKELTAEQVYEKCSKATVEIVAEIAGDKYNLGSGFFIDNGEVITNFHVVAGADRIQVTTSDNKAYDVQQVLGYDEKIDLAILKINSQNESLKESKDGVKTGETIYILGSPLGLTGTFADGMVSSPSRKIENVDYIQVTAPMSPGNSGGPLLNKYGEVMGVNTWQYADGQNLNFSIDINEIDNIKTDKPLSIADFYQLTAGYTDNSGEGDTSFNPEDIKSMQSSELTSSLNITSMIADIVKSTRFYYGFLLLPDSDKTDYAMLIFK